MRKLNSIALVALAIALGSATALADNFQAGGGSQTATLAGPSTIAGSYGGGSITGSTLNGVSLPWVYCVDIPDEFYLNGSYPTTIVTNNGTIIVGTNNLADGGVSGTVGDLGTVTNDVKVAWLLQNYAAAAENSDSSQSELQSAIWDVIYGGVPTPGTNADYDNLMAQTSPLPNYVSDFDWLTPQPPSPTVPSQGLVTVPDGGMTVMLLGGALVGIETLRRKFRV